MTVVEICYLLVSNKKKLLTVQATKEVGTFTPKQQFWKKIANLFKG
jgi:hypothetical protein